MRYYRSYAFVFFFSQFLAVMIAELNAAAYLTVELHLIHDADAPYRESVWHLVSE